MELENKSGKTNKPEPANKPEKAILLSRACAVIMIILYAGVLLRYDIKEDAGEFPVYGLASICSIMAGSILVSGLKNYKTGKWKKRHCSSNCGGFSDGGGKKLESYRNGPAYHDGMAGFVFQVCIGAFLAHMDIGGYENFRIWSG
jgi:hypothetical protein